jgi:nitroreductase
MKNDIEKIITDGTFAPSGENCQPWKFVVEENKVSIFNIPEADKSLYNSKQKGTYVSHGALIENIVISASKHGYSTDVQIFPLKNEPDLVSVISFNKTTPKNEALYPYIEKRCTNRKDYTGQKLSEDQKRELMASVRETGFGELKLIDNETSLNTLGKALAVNEQIIFENKHLHDFFYNHILWKEEDQNKAGGFYIKTLEFLPHQLKGVKLFKSWFILKILNKVVGVSKMIVKENAEKYAKSGTLGAVVVNGNTSKDFVNAGRAVQRVWLTVTKLGLSAHPCTGVLYFTEQIDDGGSSAFSAKHLEMIKHAYKDIISVFGTGGKTIPMLFRIGHANEPTARSMRMKPSILNTR